ncbi:ABC transporter substrate-binding protein [Hoeflea olei]|uniref:ABC transporter substrate-binding protein n=1 Tax=Hoeflea olei TaxID=1480615 RepID=A0A1C1YRB8_9HYPH|nr:ABC transporter substrate-binding protein [Hoeflea olei]OCW55966.1 ABC transporter substrate-binding protein [Hoeflea olei]
MAAAALPVRIGLALVLLAGAGSAADAAGPPRRVVSMNVCTDQMAMLVAAPGQLHSVSHVASDPNSSALAAEAGAFVANRGSAEEIFLMRPDLVLAGTYTTRSTVALLRQLGIRVEEFAPESSFDDIRENFQRMGEILGQPQRAAARMAELDRRLAAIATDGHEGMTVAAWYANSYTSGSGTLVDAVIERAGLTNIADRLGYAGMARLPLELLLMSAPDLLVTADRGYMAPALAQQGFDHPAFRAQARLSGLVDIASRYTVCGAPFTAEAVRALAGGADARGAPTR